MLFIFYTWWLNEWSIRQLTLSNQPNNSIKKYNDAGDNLKQANISLTGHSILYIKQWLIVYSVKINQTNFTER